MSERVAILGGGSWGTALALILGQAGKEVTLWARDETLVAEFHRSHLNRQYLPEIPLPASVRMTHDLKESVEGAEAILWAVPSGAFRAVAQSVAPYISQDALLISTTKGLEEGSGLRMSELLALAFSCAEPRIVALSGPNLALEVARGVPTATVAASQSKEAAQGAQSLFLGATQPTFRVYTSRDVIGVELGGAIKNVIAIGAGICEGLGFGDNAKAALVTRGLAEIVRLGVCLGAEPETFLGLSGVGDLFATTSSRLSRNYRVGLGLGQGEPLPAILERLGQVAEGVPTTQVVSQLASKHRVEMPLCHALASVLFESRTATEVIRELMLRPPKEELAT